MSARRSALPVLAFLLATMSVPVSGSGEGAPAPTCLAGLSSPDVEVLALLLPGGLLPRSPWEGLGDDGRETCWALAARGFLVQRLSWSGYLLVLPTGTSELLYPAMQRLASAELLPDTGFWSSTLETSSGTPGEAVLLRITHETAGPPAAPDLPFRSMGWLDHEPDTLVIPGPWENDVFLMVSGSESAWGPDLAHAFWRGLSVEPVVGLAGSAAVLATSCVTGTPSDLHGLDVLPSSADSLYAGDFAEAVGIIDSVLISQHELHPAYGGKLLWARGLGYGDRLTPWRSVPLPHPGAHSSVVVEMPGVLPGSSVLHPEPPDMGVLRLATVGTGGMRGDGVLVLGCLLERMIAVASEPDLGPGMGIMVLPRGDSLDVFLTGAHPEEDAIPSLDVVWERLRPTVLVPPSRSMIGNSAVRASVISGREILPPEEHEIVMSLAGIVGLE